MRTLCENRLSIKRRILGDSDRAVESSAGSLILQVKGNDKLERGNIHITVKGGVQSVINDKFRPLDSHPVGQPYRRISVISGIRIVRAHIIGWNSIDEILGRGGIPCQNIVVDLQFRDLYLTGRNEQDLDIVTIHIIFVLRNVQGDITAQTHIGSERTLLTPILDNILLSNNLNLIVGPNDVHRYRELVDHIGLTDGTAGERYLVINLLLLVLPPVRIFRGSEILVALPRQNQFEVRLVVITFLNTDRVSIVMSQLITTVVSDSDVFHIVIGVLEQITGTVSNS